MTLLANIVVGLLLIVGSGFSLIAALGLVRFPDVYTRMHAASKAGTLGSGLLLVAIGLYSLDFAVATRAVAGFVFILLTTPVSAHLLARAALVRGYEPAPETWVNDYQPPLPPRKKKAEGPPSDALPGQSIANPVKS